MVWGGNVIILYRIQRPKTEVSTQKNVDKQTEQTREREKINKTHLDVNSGPDVDSVTIDNNATSFIFWSDINLTFGC